jgi:hypothetical protein
MLQSAHADCGSYPWLILIKSVFGPLPLLACWLSLSFTCRCAIQKTNYGILGTNPPEVVLNPPEKIIVLLIVQYAGKGMILDKHEGIYPPVMYAINTQIE